MACHVYILQSASTGRYYCGTTNDLERRLREHNDPTFIGTRTTKRFTGPWTLIWTESHPSRAKAMTREKQIKKRGIARFLETAPKPE